MAKLSKDQLFRDKTSHFELNNFYNEYYHAKSVRASIPEQVVPNSVRKLFVKVICLCIVGNGKGYKDGVNERALPFYRDFIEGFAIAEVKDFISVFSDPEFVTDLNYTKPDERIRKLATFFKTKTKDTHINHILDLIIDFPSRSLQNFASKAKHKEGIKFIYFLSLNFST